MAALGLAFAAGLLKPGAAWADAWNKAAFETKSLNDAVKALGGAAPSESKDIAINSPDIAENGAVVPFTVSSKLPKTESIALLVEKNPNILTATFAIPEGTARSHIMLPSLLPAQFQKRFSTVIRDVATTGNSGSGVFDAGQKCLLGIVSRKITVRPNTADAESEQKDIAKYFVPASTIRTFVPHEYRF